MDDKLFDQLLRKAVHLYVHRQPEPDSGMLWQKIKKSINAYEFDLLYARYGREMSKVANSILRDEYLAEDAVQQALLSLFIYLNRIDVTKTRPTKKYVLTVIKNASIKLYNKRKKQNELAFDEIENLFGDGTIDFNGTIEANAGYLIDALEALHLRYREVLLLKYVDGYTNEEIARMMNTTGENVKKLLQRAKKKLKNHYDIANSYLPH